MRHELNIGCRCRIVAEWIKPVVFYRSKELLKPPFFFLVINPFIVHILGPLLGCDWT